MRTETARFSGSRSGYRTDAGATFNTIISSTVPGADRTFQWNVPPGINTATARIRVIAFDDAGGQGQDDSNENFSITDNTVTVLTPNGGEMLRFGQTFQITWDVPASLTGQVTGFDIFLSTNSGVTFNIPIAFNGPNNPAIVAGDTHLHMDHHRGLGRLHLDGKDTGRGPAVERHDFSRPEQRGLLYRRAWADYRYERD